MANILQTIEAEEKARLTAVRAIPDFQPGDTLRVNVKIKEGERERVQAFEGVCIARAGGVVRRAKLYYLRDRRGKSARIAERQTVRPAKGAIVPVTGTAETPTDEA